MNTVASPARLITHPAGQLAHALGLSPQAIRQRLLGVPPSSQLMVNSNPTKAWSLAALPASLQTELEAAARRRGYRDAGHLLASLPAPSQPGVAGTGANPSRSAASPSYDHSALGHRLAFADAAKPTLTERQNALEYSFRHFEELATISPGARAEIKRSILFFLYANAPALARSLAALRRNWHRKYDRWRKNGQAPAAVADMRPVNSGSRCLVDLEADLNLIADTAYEHDGKVAIAIRKLRRDGKLSETFVQRYTLDVRRDKSYVAKSVRAEIKARLAGLLNYRRSQWAVKMAGPRIARSHDYAPGDYFAADDCTFNVVFWFLDDHGRPAVTRGEVLLFFDCFSLYPLGYILGCGPYNGETVRRGILNVHDKHGLPHRAFIFEKGIWKSRLLLGSRPRDFLGWDEYEMGLRERGLGLELRNATTPQGKLIEGIFNILQQNQRNEPGFIGFNARDYGQEGLQTFIGRVKRGLVHPSKQFYSDVEWGAALDRSLKSYMHEPQNGRLQGKTPAEMFAPHQPLIQLPTNARFLLASHRVRAKVKDNGLTIDIRGHRRSFYNEALGQFRGRDVFAWFNIEQPDLLTVTSLDGKTVFSIKRHVLPAFDATDEQLAEANRDRAGFMRPAKLRYDNIQHPVRNSIVRDDVIDDDAKALGAHIRQETEKHEAEQSERQRKLGQLARAAEAAGVPIRANYRNVDRVLEATKGLQELRREMAGAPEVPAPAQASVPGQKIYTLNKPAAVRPPSVQDYFRLWEQVKRAKPGTPDNLRHALTRKALHCNPLVHQMTAAQLQKMIDVFSAVLRGAKKATAV